MAKRTTNRNNSKEIEKDDPILRQLLRDPTKSINDMAKKLKLYRQKIWRRKKKLEEENIIWGYTAVVDESKLNHVTYMVLMKMKPMSKNLAELMIRRITTGEPSKQSIRLIDVLYVNGEYDLVLRFSALGHAFARRYFDSLRVAYADHLLEKPVLVDVNFSLLKEGKMNPEIKKLYEFHRERCDLSSAKKRRSAAPRRGRFPG